MDGAGGVPAATVGGGAVRRTDGQAESERKGQLQYAEIFLEKYLMYQKSCFFNQNGAFYKNTGPFPLCHV